MWKPINKEQLGLSDSISNFIKQLEIEGKTSFPDFSNSKCLLMLSDYGGEHKNAHFNCYTFLIIDFAELIPFSFHQDKLRAQFSLDRRIIDYKKLNDNVRLRALSPFLSLSDNLNGIIISLLVHKKTESLFSFGKLDFNSESLQPVVSVWNNKTIEKLLRIIHFAGLCLAGLSHPMQDIWWITDQDDIVEDKNKLTVLTNLFGSIASHYLDHNLGHLKVGRTNVEKDTIYFEDLCSLTDLVSGAFVDLFTEFEKKAGYNISQHMLPILPASTKTKNNIICSWFSQKKQPVKLKKIALMLHPGIDSKISTRHIDLYTM